jgi:hypothetical protein
MGAEVFDQLDHARKKVNSHSKAEMICVRDAVHLCFIVQIHLTKSIQITNTELQAEGEVGPHDGAQLLGIATQDDIGPVVSHSLDWYHRFWFSSLSRFIDEDVGKVSTRDADPVRNRSRYTRRHNDAKLHEFPLWWDTEGAMVVLATDKLKSLWESGLHSAWRIHAEKLRSPYYYQAFGDEITCRVTWCAGEYAGLRVLQEYLADGLNNGDSLSGSRTTKV